MGLKRSIVLFGVLLYISDGILFSLVAPLFPVEAITHKGISIQAVASITMSFDVSRTLGFMLGSYIFTPSNQYDYFCFGALSSAVLSAVFGCTAWFLSDNWFIVTCFVTRSIQGVTSSFMAGTGIPMLCSIMPEWGSRIASFTEFGTGVGSLVGPVVASLLYVVGGFVFPFLTMAVVQILLIVVIWILLYQHSKLYSDVKNDTETSSEVANQTQFSVKYNSEEKKASLSSSSGSYKSFSTFAFLSRPVILFGFLPTFTVAAASGCINMVLGPYLYNHYGIDNDRIGFYFLSMGICFTIGTVLVGVLAQHGYSFHLPLLAQFFASLGYSTFFAAQYVDILRNQVLLLGVLSMEGLCHAASFVPAFYNLEISAQNEGFTDLSQIRSTVSPLLMLVFSVGRIAGTFVTGGLIAQYWGIPSSMLAVSLLILTSCLLFWIPFSKFLKNRTSPQCNISVTKFEENLKLEV